MRRIEENYKNKEQKLKAVNTGKGSNIGSSMEYASQHNQILIEAVKDKISLIESFTC